MPKERERERARARAYCTIMDERATEKKRNSKSSEAILTRNKKGDNE
jgi:hypothetical protein